MALLVVEAVAELLPLKPAPAGSVSLLKNISRLLCNCRISKMKNQIECKEELNFQSQGSAPPSPFNARKYLWVVKNRVNCSENQKKGGGFL